jgi:ABC-2 type transport system ATP-binding protein
MSIVVSGLTKYYGGSRAVDNLSFSVRTGEIVGLLGPNGAGKTTVVRMITGYLTPSSGTIEVHGKDVSRDLFEVRRMIGYLPEDNPLYTDLDVMDHLRYVAELQGVPRKMIPRRIRSLVEAFTLQSVTHMEVGRLSKGFRQRVGLAAAMLHLPQVLLLDEPTNSLDPNQILEFRQAIRQLGREKTIILSTHTLSEVQAVCDRVIILDKGHKLADSPINDLAVRFEGMQRFFLGVDLPPGGDPDRAAQFLRALPGVQLVSPLTQQDEEQTTGFYLEATPEGNVRKEIFGLCVRQGWTLVHLHRGRVQIDDIFHRITTGQTAS